MAKKKTETENLPAVLLSIPAGYQTFDLSKIENDHATEGLDPEVAAMYSEEESGGYVSVPKTLSWVSIRQKPPTDDKGKVIGDGGGFKMQNKLGNLPDVQEGLYVSVLLVEATQSRWIKGKIDAPVCKAVDGMFGEGDPGGECAKCSYSKFLYNQETKQKERPVCAKAYHLLCMDLTQPGSFFILVIKRSGLKYWQEFAGWANTQKLTIDNRTFTRPIHSYNIHITTEYVPKQGDKEAYWTPRFVSVGPLNKDFANQVRMALPDLRNQFVSEVATTDHHEEETNQRLPGNDQGGELPPGATPVDPTETGDPPESNRIPGI